MRDIAKLIEYRRLVNFCNSSHKGHLCATKQYIADLMPLLIDNNLPRKWDSKNDIYFLTFDYSSFQALKKILSRLGSKMRSTKNTIVRARANCMDRPEISARAITSNERTAINIRLTKIDRAAQPEKTSHRNISFRDCEKRGVKKLLSKNKLYKSF